jgi:hypothetical protein
MATAELPLQPVSPNRAALALVGALAAGLGVLPYLLWIDRLSYLWALVPASGVLVALSLRDFKTEATAQPSAPEWALGAWSAVAMPATISFMGLTFYGMGYGLQRLLALALQAFGHAPMGDASVWGYWASVWLVAVGVMMACTRRLPEVARQLYPREAWSRTAFQPLLARKRTLVLGALTGLLSLGALLWWLDWHGHALPILLSLLFFYTSFPLADLGKIQPDLLHANAVAALERLLTQQGYTVLRTPRTGKAETDPLLQSVDLLARGPAQAFAIELRTMASATPVEWQAANAVRTAATLLSDEPGPGGAPPVPVQPLLVLMGGRVAQSLAAFSQRERVPLVHLPEAGKALADQDQLVPQFQAAGLAMPAAAATRGA